MIFIECCKKVVEEKQCYLIRNRKGTNELDIKKGEGKKSGWVYLDLFTASAVVKIYDSLNNKNKDSFSKMDVNSAITTTWRLMG